MSGSKVDRECSFSKIDREIKDNALETIQESERQLDNLLYNQLSLTNEVIGVIDSLFSFLGDSLGSFLEPSSPHYDATLADYILALKARKRQVQSRIKISRIR